MVYPVSTPKEDTIWPAPFPARLPPTTPEHFPSEAETMIVSGIQFTPPTAANPIPLVGPDGKMKIGTISQVVPNKNGSIATVAINGIGSNVSARDLKWSIDANGNVTAMATSKLLETFLSVGAASPANDTIKMPMPQKKQM